MMKKSILFFIVINLFLLKFINGQETDSLISQVKFSLKLSEKISWPESKNHTVFSVGYFGYNHINLESLLKATSDILEFSKPISYTSFSSIADIENVDVLIVSNLMNSDLEDIFYQIAGKPILLISNKSTNENYFLINIYPSHSDYTFEINKANFLIQNLGFRKLIETEKVNTVDLAELFFERYKQNKLENETILQQQMQMEKQLGIIWRQKQSILKFEKRVNVLENGLAKQQLRQINSEAKFQELDSNLRIQNKSYKLQNQEIKNQKKLINKQLKSISEQTAILQNQQKSMIEQQNKIDKQKVILEQQNLNLSFQKSLMYVISIILFLVILLVVFIYSHFRKNKRITQILEIKNKEISLQKEELEANANHLAEANVELERLSIVASKTDNAIMLLDSTGKIVWVNKAYEKLYGINVNDLDSLNGISIFELSKNTDIKEYFFHALNKVESVNYESKSTNKKGEVFYIRTTLTPIVKDGVVNLLVAIDTDISDMRKAEQEISSQAFELREISDMLSDQKRQLEAKNENINASIRSAEIIQSTILPQNSELTENFDSFVLFRPREIVSGDFYWYAKAFSKTANKEYSYYAAVDCTGHGVPGAFMSLIGSRLLNEILHIDKLFEPKDILEVLNTKFVHALKQELTDNRDGMDVALIRLENDKKGNQTEIIFSGAKRNLYVLEQDADGVMVVKGNRKKIGGPKTRNQESFSQEILNVNKGTMLYLTSDGYIDQNNPERKRFGTKKLLSKLLEINGLDMKEQKISLERTLDDYMEYAEQRDDITILGVKIN